ncbi:CorA family divalent cation transporter [Streptomyces sp. NPDC058682]|uniref:CorA family divalent cation transporter n=1 Tax=Streptomyces sp. NPDC058682 TaxID=3346596 RepID=UPI0036535142
MLRTTVRRTSPANWNSSPIRDVADHLHRTDIEVRTLDELWGSVLGAQQARVGTWQSDDIRRISAWAAIFAIPTMVAGVYGMNFEHMPELGWTYGYPLAVALMAIAAGCPLRCLPSQRLAVEACTGGSPDPAGSLSWCHAAGRCSGRPPLRREQSMRPCGQGPGSRVPSRT